MSHSILLICDEEDDATFWARALQSRTWRVLIVSMAEAAADSGSTPLSDLIIIDIESTPAAGIDFYRRLRQTTPAPILLLNSGQDEVQALVAYQVGVDECILKPISPLLFLAKVAAWLRHSRSIAADGQPRFRSP